MEFSMFSESEELVESSEEPDVLVEDAGREDLPSFSCMEVGPCLQNCHPEGLLCSGLVQRLLHREEPSPGSFLEEGAVELFRHSFVTCTVFSSDARVPFMLFQQSVGGILDGAEGDRSRDQLQPSFQQCIIFLHFLECYVHRYLVMADHSDRFHLGVDSVTMEIVADLPHLCTQLDPLEEQLSMLKLGGWGQQAVTNHIAHLVMHSHWTVLSVLYRLVPVVGSAQFLKEAYTTIRRLLAHAAVKYSKVASGRERLVASMFPCACVRELWLLLRFTLDRLADTSNSKSFWMLVSQVLGEVLHSSDPEEEDYVPIAPGDVVGFSWWVLSQLAPLYRYSQDGVLRNTDTVSLPGNWVFVQELLPLTFKQSVSESELRGPLHSCLSLSHHWTPATEPVARAWDYFYKHMNDSFHLPGRGLRDWITPEGSTPQQWLQYAHTLCNGCHGNSDPVLPERTSFELFLSLLAAVLKRGGDMWRQLKGRFYSKLHKRWLQGLKGAGVTHLVSLLLTLASAGDAGEVGSKMVGLLTTLDLHSPKEHITPVLWRGIFSLLLLFEERALNMAPIVERLTPAITSLMRQLSSGSCDHRLLWETVSVVLDGVQDLMEMPGGVALGATGMIGGYLGELLTSLGGSELARVLQLVEGVASSLSSHHHTLTTHTTSQVHQPKLEDLKGVYHSFWQHCGSALLSKSQDPLPSPHLPTTTAALTISTCECSPLFPLSSPATTLFEELGLSDSTSPSFTSAYLCHVISNDVTRQTLATPEPTQWRVLHAWLRCVLQQHNPPACTAHVQELTRLLWQLPVAVGLLQSDDPVSLEPLPVLHTLLRAITQAHDTAATVQESFQWRERLGILLGDLLKYMEPALSGNTAGEGLRTSYKVAAAVVKTCPRLVYSKSDSRCLLPRLVDACLCLTSTKKAPVQGITICIRTHLHHFVHGLLQLDPRRDDFIRRKIKQLFSRYFQSYAQPAHPLTPSVPNPFMVLLQPCFSSTVSEETSEQLLFILEIVTAQSLAFPQQPSSLLPTLQFLRTVVERIKYQKLLTMCTPPLLGNMLSCLLACDVCSRHSEPQGVRKQVMGILKALLQACHLAKSTATLTSLLPILRDFIFSNMKQCQAAVFKPLLVLADLHPSLVRGVLPAALRAVEEVEGRRGCGKDASLRSAYHSLESRVHHTH